MADLSLAPIVWALALLITAVAAAVLIHARRRGAVPGLRLELRTPSTTLALFAGEGAVPPLPSAPGPALPAPPGIAEPPPE